MPANKQMLKTVAFNSHSTFDDQLEKAFLNDLNSSMDILKM